MPKYEPSKWNDGGRVQTGNNCYDYAIDRPSGKLRHKSQPGRANGHRLRYPFTCADVTDGAVKDGLDKSTKDGDCDNEKCWKVALAVDPTHPSDYHWYRQDDGGKWSHKPGWGKATNKDFGTPPQEIANPETANRGRYTQFCGYFCVCPDEVVVASADLGGQSELFAALTLKETAHLVSSSLDLQLPPGNIRILYDSQTSTTMPSTPGVTAYAQIYSGREDPSWQMAPSDIEILKSKLEKLPPYEPQGLPSDGYQGFYLMSKEMSGLPEMIHVYKGCISIPEGEGRIRYYEDRNNIEEWLVILACAQSFGEDFKLVLASTKE